MNGSTMSVAQRDGAEDDDPIAWFQRCFEAACAAESFDACRAALATASAEGRPSVRFVLVKQVDARGFGFFTNYESHKARDLAENPRAALAFHWASTGMQVRVEGTVVRMPESESDAYFAMRPRGSQLGAWASVQSAQIADRATLQAKLDAVTQRFGATEPVPRPQLWGGYRLQPELIEFWSDRRDRLHDRHCFTRDGASWTRSRLQP
jgi:pyridoxamine 5'-phosphate oxidase